MEGLGIESSLSIAVNIIIILIFLADIRKGYKKGLIQSIIQFITSVITFILAYFLKTPLSTFLYTNYHFFELEGIFEGMTSINILIYESISFVILFVTISIILSIISKLLKLDEKITKLITLTGIFNKLLGSILGALKSIIILYFLISGLTIVSNITNLDLSSTLSNYILEIPVLKNTLGNNIESSEKLNDLAKEYKNNKDKTELNNKAIDILLEYEIITKENLEILIKSGKIVYNINNAEEQKDMMEDLNEAFNK